MIDFTRAFDSAWERMHVILFRPFDFGKWCAIGLSAFLAGLLAGGNGVNFNGNFNNDAFKNTGSTSNPTLDLHDFNAKVGQAFSAVQAGTLIAIVLVVFVFVF